MPSPLLHISAATGLAVQPMPHAAARIAGAALTSGGAFRFLQTLTDTIGPRLTGSDGSRRAAELLVATLTEAGLERVHIEEYALPSSWRRGTASARVTSPVDQALMIQSFGWVGSTPGEIEAPLVDIGAPVPSGLAAFADRVHGRIVLADFRDSDGGFGHVKRAAAARFLARAGALALLIPSEKPGRLLDVNCFGNLPKAALPMASIAREDSLFLRRLLSTQSVRVAVRIDNALEQRPATERNVIADWRGSAAPDEMVIVGAHFDSWDTATGANDDGSGVAAIVEAARVIASLGPLGMRPRRTIRFAFFSGEEQALLGSHAYVRAHRDELDRLKAVLIMDEGAGAPRGFKLHGRADVATIAERVLAPLGALDATGLSQEASFNQDHAFFLAEGIPVLTLWVHPGEYYTHRHAITDTLDKIDPRMLAIDTAVMGIAAYSLADGEPIGRRLTPEESATLLRDTNLEETFRLLSRSLILNHRSR